ncbi:MAG: glycerophosphodiester phosphodiesterase [Methylococcaceae bacterium]|nr:glycerophosphodiester phosphodiesterase [Methylococcaceae bacterium]
MKPCLIYAHRGISSEYLENTRGAFDRAVELGVDGIETDVQISKDAVSVLWHDEHLARIGRPEARIGELDYAQLSNLGLSNYGKTDGSETGLVRLDEFISKYVGRCNLILEVKNLAWDRNSGRHSINIAQCLKAAKRIARAAPDSGLVISSFDLDSLVYAHSQEPMQALVYNLDDGFRIDELQRALDENDFFQGYCLPVGDLNIQAAQLLADYRKSLIVYTCNTIDQIRKAFDLGVDILISDYPHKAIELRY